MFNNQYQNKKVLITGHTGFKGSWLTTWLLGLGAKVVGISKDIPTNPSMYEILDLDKHIKSYFLDIRALEDLREVIEKEKPDFIFHLAAQAIVSVSYDDPVETITSNAIGTMNILEILRFAKWDCSAVIITSDKCYDNVEWVWGYKETDAIGGKDIYSGSKGAAELIIKSYFESFFVGKDHPVKIAIARAGNVLGGGDWAKDRIVVDCMKAWNDNQLVEIRSPNATRPWQHVLEPLSGYLLLGSLLSESNEINGEAFNFGPRSEQNRTVLELLEDLALQWRNLDKDSIYTITDNIPFHEAGLLKLNCDKALFYLRWEANLDYEETTRFVGQWYYKYYREEVDIYNYTMSQIEEYEQLAKERNKVWTK